MKKITFFIYNMYTDGGTERVLSLIANELVKKYEVDVVSLYKTSETPFYNLDSRINLMYILEKELNPIRLYFPYLQYKLKKFFKDYKTDTFISAGMKYIGLNIFMRKRAKYIAWEHYNCVNTKVGSITWFGRKLAARYADKIVVLTEKDMQMNIELFKTAKKIEQIYNPMDTKILSEKYDIYSKKIVSAGRLSQVKGYDFLMDIAEKVFSKHSDWEWHIYGEGPEREVLENLIIQKGLQKNVKLMGRTNKMKELYKEYAMFVMTSRAEGFAMVNIEAHLAKLPIVSFNCNCGPDEIIENGINGYLVDCFDLDAMAEKINYLIENPEVRKNFSENTGLDKEKLQLENIIKKWEEII